MAEGKKHAGDFHSHGGEGSKPDQSNKGRSKMTLGSLLGSFSARKMNVDSIRSNAALKSSSAEVRIAKTAFCVIVLFLFSWVPYISVAFMAGFSDPKSRRITPVLSMIPALTLKASACFDPFFYAISHPRYRQELQNRVPWLCINEKAEAAHANGTCDEVSKTTEHA